MKNVFRFLLAGWLARKFGARAGLGCFGFVILFILLMMGIGYLLRQAGM